MTISDDPYAISMVANGLGPEVVAQALARCIVNRHQHPMLSIREYLHDRLNSANRRSLPQQYTEFIGNRKFTKPTGSGHSTLWSNRGIGSDPDLKAYSDSRDRKDRYPTERFSRDSTSQRTTFKIHRGGQGMIGSRTNYIENHDSLNTALNDLSDKRWSEVIHQWTEYDPSINDFVESWDAIGSVMQHGRKVSLEDQQNRYSNYTGACIFVRALAHVQRGANIDNPMLSDIITYDGEYARGHPFIHMMRDKDGNHHPTFNNEMHDGSIKVGKSWPAFVIKFIANTSRTGGVEAVVLSDRLAQEHAERFESLDEAIFRAIMTESYNTPYHTNKGENAPAIPEGKVFNYQGIKIFRTGRGQFHRRDLKTDDIGNFWAKRRLNTRLNRCRTSKGAKTDGQGKLILNTQNRNCGNNNGTAGNRRMNQGTRTKQQPRKGKQAERGVNRESKGVSHPTGRNNSESINRANE